MTTPVSPELRSEILASIKSGTSVADAATRHQVSPKTISKWMRQLGASTHASTNELRKAKIHIEFLERVILDLVLEQKSQTYKG